MVRKLVVDITYLAHWRGKLTGVPRVINELVSRYEAQGECIFVVWSDLEGEFYEVNVAETLQNRGERQSFKQRGAVSKNLKLPLVPVGILLRILLLVKNRHNRLIPTTIIGALSRLHKIRFKKYRPSTGHTILVPLGDWADEKYANRLVKYSGLGVDIIQVCYDMLPLVTPQYSGQFKNKMYKYNKKVFPIAKCILVISEATKNDLLKWMKLERLQAPPVKVFRLGEDFKLSSPQKPKDKKLKRLGINTGEPFILCVGTVEARKNHTLLYYVYKLAKERNVTLPKLVIVGRRGWRTDNIFDIMNDDPDVNEDIIFLTNTSDEELAWLYKNCQFSIYPSFYEGWGLPIAESIAYGTPCLASNTSSMPEIAGDLIKYFSPVSTDGCLMAIESMLDSKNLMLAREKIKSYKATDWDEVYDQFNRYIKECYE